MTESPFTFISEALFRANTESIIDDSAISLILSGTYIWRRGEFIFQPKDLRMKAFEDTLQRCFLIEPGSAVRVYREGGEGVSDDVIHSAWRYAMDRMTLEHPSYVPVKECDPINGDLLRRYEALSEL